ncbi:MAG: uracil-DNA glycosylase family protein [Terriglobia bacterium]
MNPSKPITAILDYFKEIGISELSSDRIRKQEKNKPLTAEPGTGPESFFSQTPPAGVGPTSPLSVSPVIPPQTRSLFAPAEATRPGETLEEIRSDLGDCRRCKLAPLRKNIVFGSGNPQAALMFVGEAPGADEDEQGLPFVGRAGQLLTRIIEAINLKREEVYICNVIKCRPPENRAPERDEIESCEPFLRRQIQAVKPRVIVCLGSPAMQTLLKIKTGITQIRGQWLDYGDGIKLMATFHPAYCLRWPDKKREVWEDMKKVRDYLRFVNAL